MTSFYRNKFYNAYMTVYIDLVFFENLILNSIILIATALIGKSEIKVLRFLFSSIVGCIYTILEYMINLSKIQNIFGKLIISSFMILIAFKCLTFKSFIKNLFVFYLTSFTFGGTALVFLFFVKPQNIIFYSGHFIGTYPIKMALLGGIVGLLLIYIVVKLIKRQIIRPYPICELEIFYNGKNVKIKSLIDSRKFIKRTN